MKQKNIVFATGTTLPGTPAKRLRNKCVEDPVTHQKYDNRMEFAVDRA
jgi:hypothetical protein